MATLQDLIKHYRPYRAIAIASIAASCIFEIVDLAVPYAIGQILNVLSHQPLDRTAEFLIHTVGQITSLSPSPSLSLGTLLGLVLLVTVIKAPIQPWLGIWYHWAIALKSRRDSSENVMAKILTLPLAFYDENNPGRISGKVSRGIMNHTWTYPEIAGDLIPKLARILGIFAVIWWIDLRIAIAFLASFIFILSLTIRKLKKLIKRETIVDQYGENTESRTSEIITNIKTVKAFGNEVTEFKRQQKRFEREYRVMVDRILRGYILLHTKQQTFIQSCVFLILLFTLIETLQGQMTLGHFITTLTLSSMAYAELEPISDLSELFARRYASMIRFQEFLAQPTGIESSCLSTQTSSEKAYKFTGKIDLNQVNFSYPNCPPVLKELNLLIHPCQTVAIVGRSGSGKSTLVKLLFRYFEPNSGRILIDGEDISNLDVTQYRKRLAIVHQEVDIFNGTLLENLTYGNPTVSFAKVEEACKIARVDEFLTGELK